MSNSGVWNQLAINVDVAIGIVRIILVLLAAGLVRIGLK